MRSIETHFLSYKPPGAFRHTCVESDAVEMLEHSNRRLHLSFFNIEMMETLRHRESTRGGRRGDCPRGRRAGPEVAVLLSGGYPSFARSLTKANEEAPTIGEA